MGFTMNLSQKYNPWKWKYTDSMVMEKSLAQQSENKIWDMNGFITTDFLEKCASVNYAF